MSHRSNQIREIWKDVEAELRRARVTRNNETMSRRNADAYRDSLLLLFLCWYDILISFQGHPSHRLSTEWIKSISVLDVRDLIGLMKEADDLLLNSVGAPELRSYDSFKHCLTNKYPFAGAIIGPAKGVIAAWNEGSISAFQSLHQMFAFISRLTLKGLKDLESDAVDAYISTDMSLIEASQDDREARIIEKWFPRDCRHMLYDNWVPKHGPGAVSDIPNKIIADKYKHLGFDLRSRYLLNKLDDQCLPREGIIPDRTSRLICVPKSAQKLRTICAEPTSLQWIQQGFFNALDLYFRGHPVLRRRIDLHDQEISRDLAWEGSIGGSLSTIDLSNASDSVSNSLSRCWFDKTLLREVLFSCRSTSVTLPNGSKHLQKKYAPMGSALCFPIECIVFSAIVEAAIENCGGRADRSIYRVFGDDIIVETEYAAAVIEELNRVGFSVNSIKSYYNSSGDYYFRESCGGEFLSGHDVAPIRLSRKFSGYSKLGPQPSRIQNLVTLANECNARLPSVRRRVIEALNSLAPPYRVPFDSTGENGLFSPTPTNWHLESCYHQGWQTTLYRCGHATSNSRNNDDDEDIRLYEYLRLTRNRERVAFDEQPLSVCVSTTAKAQWRPKWDPLYFPE